MCARCRCTISCCAVALLLRWRSILAEIAVFRNSRGGPGCAQRNTQFLARNPNKNVAAFFIAVGVLFFTLFFKFAFGAKNAELPSGIRRRQKLFSDLFFVRL